MAEGTEASGIQQRHEWLIWIPAVARFVVMCGESPRKAVEALHLASGAEARVVRISYDDSRQHDHYDDGRCKREFVGKGDKKSAHLSALWSDHLDDMYTIRVR